MTIPSLSSHFKFMEIVCLRVTFVISTFENRNGATMVSLSQQTSFLKKNESIQVQQLNACGDDKWDDEPKPTEQVENGGELIN
jgi:hypothetical protein